MTGRYLDLLTTQELLILGTASGMPSGTNPVALFRGHPLLVAEALSRQTTLDRLTDPGSASAGASTRLRLASAVSRFASDITRAGYTADVHAGRVFVGESHDAEFVAHVGTNRFRLEATELLFSYLRPGRDHDDLLVTSDAAPHPLHSILDAHSIVPLIEELHRTPEDEHAGLYRRLGDLAAFTVGVFPDHADSIRVDRALFEITRRSLPLRLRVLCDEADARGLFGDDTLTSLLYQIGPIWYRAASQRIAWPVIAEPILAMAEHFDTSVTFLQMLTSASLLESRDDLFDFRLIW